MLDYFWRYVRVYPGRDLHSIGDNNVQFGHVPGIDSLDLIRSFGAGPDLFDNDWPSREVQAFALFDKNALRT